MTIFRVVTRDGHVKFPVKCPCCNERGISSVHHHSSENYEKSGGFQVKSTYSFDIPYCETCQRHAKMYNSDLKYLAFIPIILLFVVPMLKTDIGFISIIIMCFILFLGLRWFLHNQSNSLMKDTCITNEWAYKFTTLQLKPNFLFFRKDYAEEYASLNGSIIQESE